MPNVILWNKENRERYGEEYKLRRDIVNKFERLYDLEKEIKNYYYRDKYTFNGKSIIRI